MGSTIWDFDNERGHATEGYEMEDIAAEEVWSLLPITRVGCVNKVWRFVDEVEMRVGTPWRTDHAGSGRVFFRKEVKVPVSETRVAKGDEIVLVGHPYVTNFVASAPLKGAVHRKQEVQKHGTATEIDVDSVRKAEARRVDPWEGGSFLTAGLIFPSAPRPVDGRMRQGGQRRLVYGVCKHRSQCIAALRTSPTITQLHELAQRGRVRTSIHAKTAALPESVYGDAPDILDNAINQALAGPAKDFERWRGKPVAMLARKIYLDELHNRLKSVATKRDPIQPGFIDPALEEWLIDQRQGDDPFEYDED